MEVAREIRVQAIKTSGISMGYEWAKLFSGLDCIDYGLYLGLIYGLYLALKNTSMAHTYTL